MTTQDQLHMREERWHIIYVRKQFYDVVAMQLQTKGYAMLSNVQQYPGPRLDYNKNRKRVQGRSYVLCKFCPTQSTQVFMIPGVIGVVELRQQQATNDKTIFRFLPAS